MGALMHTSDVTFRQITLTIVMNISRQMQSIELVTRLADSSRIGIA